jgi:membrane protein
MEAAFKVGMDIRSIIGLLRQAAELWSARHAFQHAGALAFYTLFSLAPLMLILTSIGAAVFGEQAARGEISDSISGLIGDPAAEVVEEAVRSSRVQEAGLLPTLLGIGALLFGATTVFAQVQRSLNQFWGVIAKPSRSNILVFAKTRLLSFGMVLILGFLLLTSLVVSMVIAAIVVYAGHWFPVPAALVAGIDLVVSLAVATLIFGMMFKVLPDVYLRWADVWRAALLTAVLFALGQYVISFYLTRAAPASTYGAAGSLVMLLLWVYYSALILFFGTAVTKVAILRRDGQVTPKKTAVRIKMVLLEETETHEWKWHDDVE